MPATILCFGDSNTYGYNPKNGFRYPKDIRWPGHLQLLLGNIACVVEEGCNGRCAAGIDVAEPWKYAPSYLHACLNSHKPVDVFMLMLGTNDLKRCFRLEVSDIADKISQILDTVESFTPDKQGFVPEVILISPPLIGEGITQGPFGDSFDDTACAKSREFAAYYRQVAQKHKCLFLDAARYTTPSDIDRLHLSEASHIALAEALANLVREKIMQEDCHF